MNQLSRAGRLFLALTVLIGTLLYGARLFNVRFDQPIVVVALVALALAAVARSAGHHWHWVAGLTPPYLTHRAYKTYLERIEKEQQQVRAAADLHLATVEALARAIGAREQPSSAHLQRSQLYAGRLAEAAGLSDLEVQAIKTAALLHDVGKLAVPEHILSKPGRLTDEEFQRVRVHPQVGADIVAGVPFPSPVAPIILGHHERFDGTGYPQGLKGEDIPLGARILSVVDYFEAVTSVRPYHRALPVEDAVALIKAEAGRALDPRLAMTFLELLPSLLEEHAALTWQVATPAPHSLVSARPPMAALARPANVPKGAYEQIALAHHEINALYEIAQAMSTGLGVTDTMAVISAKLLPVVPWSACTLSLYNSESQTLKCRFAAGQHASPLLDTVHSIDVGLDGWVARNRRTLVNSSPAVTFEAAGLQATALKSALVCPLLSNDVLVGVLSLFHVDKDWYTEDHRRLLERVASQAGTVIGNSLVFEQTQEDALTDSLTGLPNRRSLSLHLGRELARAERVASEFAIVVIDVDGLKQINDTYGHPVGDWTLREVATTLASRLRPYDLCVRYAGDEFVLVLSDCSREVAEARRLDVQKSVGEIALPVLENKTLSPGISAGAAVFPHDGTSYETLVARADRRMYRDKAKRTGRTTWPPMTAHVAVPALGGRKQAVTDARV